MPIEFKQLHHITITAPSGEQKKARWFYGEILGLKEIPIPRQLQDKYELLWYELLAFSLHIEFSKNFIKPRESYENGAILVGNHVALLVKEIQKVRKLFERSGVDVRDAVTLADRNRFYVIDPFGNFFEFIEFHQA